MAIQVSAEKFDEDFKAKLSSALATAFGQETKVEFQEAPPGETEEEKKKRLEEEAKKSEEEQKKQDEQGKMMTEQQKQIVALQSEAKAWNDRAVKIEKEFASFKEDTSKREKDARDLEINSLLESAKDEGRVLPAFEETAKVMLTQADPTKFVKFTKDGKETEVSEYEMVKNFIQSLPIAVHFKELAPTGGGGGDGGEGSFPRKMTRKGEEYSVLDIDLDQKARSYAQRHNVSYDEALLKVSG